MKAMNRFVLGDGQGDRIKDLLPGKSGDCGVTAKIHAAVDAVGNPVRTILTGGQQADITQAEGLDGMLCGK
jgi:hypothetical protein